jgi:hypothetical protein
VVEEDIQDAREAMLYYGGTLNIRRSALRLRDAEVKVQRVRLIYEGGELTPQTPGVLQAPIKSAQDAVRGVEVLVQ